MYYRNLNYIASTIVKSLVIIIAFTFFVTSPAYCKDIGTFLRVIGQVFHLKENKPPGTPAKVLEVADKGDGVHTKEASRAHLRLIDTSDLFIAPKSEIVLDYYPLVAHRITEETVATLLTKGIVHCIINFLYKTNPTAFFIKTEHTMGGIRGTDLYVLTAKNFTDYFVKNGHIVVTSIQSNRIGNGRSGLYIFEKQMEIRAGGGGASAVLKGAVIIGRDSHLGPQQAVRVVEGMPPSEVVSVPLEYFDRLEKLMKIGLPDHFQEGSDPKQLLELIGPL